MAKNYTVRIAGLAADTHHFEFSVTDEFFADIEFGEIRKGNLLVKIEMVLEASMIVLDFHIRGTVQTLCDRCSEFYDQEIEGNNQLIVKYGDSILQNTDDILIIARGESEIPVASYIYEFTHLLLPQRRIHSEGQCNQEVVDRLEELNTASKFSDGDPRWDALRGVL